MDISHRLSISYYKVITPINESHKVYLVRHQESGRFYVKKILDVYSADVYRDLQEHPISGIPRIIDSWEDNGSLIIIEEFISGLTLRDKIDFALTKSCDFETKTICDVLTIEQIGHYMINLCEILERLHSHNPPLVHRDLKPSNIMITSCDNVVLLDFNAARFYTGIDGRESDTKLLGTKGYAAPEQYGFGESSPQTDIFSVGKILQECVNALTSQSCDSENSSLKENVFSDVIQRCTQMDPSRRYPSVHALKDALLNCLGQSSRPDIQGPVINPYLPPGFRTLNPWKMIIASVVYIFIFQISLTLTIQNSSGTELWIERFLVLFLALMNVAIGSNYLNIQQFLPFHDSRSRGMQVVGVLLTMAISTFLIFVATIFFISVFLY